MTYGDADSAARELQPSTEHLLFVGVEGSKVELDDLANLCQLTDRMANQQVSRAF